jgi:gliding motility-associated-like protein
MSVSGVNGCSSYTATATYSVTIDPEPTASAGGTKIICENASATVSGASAPIGSISWGNNGSGSLSNPTTLTPTYTPLVADTGSTVTLTMTVTTTNACSAIMPTAIYSVNVDPLPRASIIGSAIQTICVIDTATVLVGEADAKSGSVRWEHDGLGSIVLGAFSSLTPSYKPAAGDAGSAVILSFIVYNSNACGSPISDTADYTINVDGLPVATAGGMDTICLNASTIVSGASASHGTISWTYPVGGGSITLGATTFTPTYTAAVGDIGSPVTLTMTVLSANTCSLTSATALAYYFITVDTLPLSIVGGDTITCENIPLTIIGASKSYGTISWTHNGLGTLSDSITLTPTYYPNTGDIGDTITLVQEVISDNKCLSNSNTDTLKLIVKPPPPSVTLSGLAPSYCFNAAATNLIGLPTGGIYSGNGIVDPVLGVFNPFVAGSGTHTIVYTYTDTSNCWDTANIATIVLTEPFVVDSCTSFNLRSNVFSPNGDGINDEFTLDFEGSASLYTGDASGNFEINIFSRWGVVVFTATSPNVTWDGYSTAGEQLTAGTYYYVIDMFGEQTRGFITLIR